MNPLLKIGVPIAVLVIGTCSLFASCSHTDTEQPATKSTSPVTNQATVDTSVETLKTVSAQMSAQQEQSRKIIAENEDLRKQLQSQKEEMKESILQQIRGEMPTVTPVKATDDKDTSKTGAGTDDYAVANANTLPPPAQPGFTWVSDLQQNRLSVPSNLMKSNDSAGIGSGSLLNSNAETSASPPTGLAEETPPPLTKKKRTIKPYFTLPVNATLTGAIAMQPIIGRVPINGKVPDPYSFKAIIGPKNLAANGVDIPSDIQGIVVSGIATGDMLGRCARGDITALTFVFQDGRISTTQAEKAGSLGTISAANGNPCINGDFHTNAPLYLGVTTGLAGAQGYANALSQAQTSSTVAPGIGGAISTLIKNGNTYALGQGGAAAAQSAQRWWDQRVQSSFDFVYVPNVDPKTGEKLRLNINITQQIEINYNLKGRKVAYAHDTQNHSSDLD